MEQYLRELLKQTSFATALGRISPVAAYQNAASALAKTDTQSYLAFMQRAKNYRRELIDYLRSKEAFGLLFFTRQKEEEMFDGEAFEKWAEAHHPVDEWRRCFSGQSEKTLPEVDPWKKVESLNLSDMPRFRYSGLSVVESINNAFGGIAILALLNVLFFLMAHLSFLRADVRR
jgi:hypothetical protein